MSPMEIWCNESQERYVLVIAAAQLAAFGALCDRERCPFAVVGDVTDDARLRVDDPLFGNTPVDMPLEVLLGKPPKMTRDVRAPAARRRRLHRGRRPRPARSRAARAAPADRGGQDLPDHDRRPHASAA